MHELVLASQIGLRIIVGIAGAVKIDVVVGLIAVLQLEGHLASTVNAHAPVVDGIAKQQRWGLEGIAILMVIA